MGKHGSSVDGAPFDDAEELKGFKKLSPDLSAEVRDLALAMRGLFKATGKSLRQFSVYHHVGASSVSRFLSGERIPEKQFLDILMKSACKVHGREVTAELQAHLYQRHREALLADQPTRYREQMASDRLEDAILQKEQAELQINDLQVSLSEQKGQLRELEDRMHQIEADCASERRFLGNELELQRQQKDALDGQCEQLRRKIKDLEAALEAAIRERDAALNRCTALEAELATTQELAEREELKRQADEERLHFAKAANVAEQNLADLERIQREAEQVRFEADRYAAAQREEAEAKAKEIIDEATTTVTRIRPSLVRRSTALRLLRNTALDIAEQRLPMLIDQLSRTDPGSVDLRVQPIPISTTDEIGEVARAFDQVHREAVRLAAEQALLRGNINAIFTKLSRRDQSLVEAQLTLITALENNEADPAQIEKLFRLDHLATRMRRNIEILLVLAGEEPGRRWDQPVPLVDILRAASSEVEQYERVELSGVPEAEIHGRAVTDLVHLLAELLENATTFSSPHTKVRVTATRLPDGRIMVEIHDNGIGFTAENLAEINERLAYAPALNTVGSQHIGLFVVGRLSHRHGIRVQLRPSVERTGTTSLIMLPDVITHGSRSR